MLKVAVITHYFPTSVTPWQGHSAYQTLRELSKICHVHVFCSTPVYPKLFKSKRKEKRIDPDWRPGGVDVTYLTYKTLPGIGRPLNGQIITNAVLPYVKQFDPDAILNYVIYPQGYAAVKIARKLRKPAVLTAIGSDLNRISDPICDALTRRTLRGADFVTTVSHDLCMTARRMGAYPGSTRPKLNGCDTSIFYPRDREEARRRLGVSLDEETIVYVGRLDLLKGLREMVEAMAILRAKRPQARCYLIGDGPAKPALQEAMVANNLGEEAVTFVPPCSTVEVADWMTASNVVALPSYMEGCPNVVVEALSSGRPVVACKVGGIPELMNNLSGRLIPPRDAEALATALDEVLEQTWDADVIHKMHGRSWQDVARDLLIIFEELLGRRANPSWANPGYSRDTMQ